MLYPKGIKKQAEMLYLTRLYLHLTDYDEDFIQNMYFATWNGDPISQKQETRIRRLWRIYEPKIEEIKKQAQAFIKENQKKSGEGELDIVP